MPLAGPRLIQIDAAQQQRQLFMTQHDFLHRAVSLRPTKSPTVQLFRTHPKPASVIYDQLQAIAPRICEQKNMAARGIAFQPVAHQTVKTVESLAHVRGARGHVNPRGRPKSEHRLRLVQYAQQALQCRRIESTAHFNSTPASRLNHQNTIAPGISVCIRRRRRRNQFHRKHRTGARARQFLHPPTVLIQGRNRQATLLTKSIPRQPTGFILRNQPLHLDPTPAPPK